LNYTRSSADSTVGVAVHSVAIARDGARLGVFSNVEYIVNIEFDNFVVVT